MRISIPAPIYLLLSTIRTWTMKLALSKIQMNNKRKIWIILLILACFFFLLLFGGTIDSSSKSKFVPKTYLFIRIFFWLSSICVCVRDVYVVRISNA